MAKPNTIALLMPVHNGLAYTRRTLDSIAKSLKNAERHRYEVRIVVIDDGSSDNTYEWIHANYPKIIVIRGDGNLWWSGSINKGIRAAEERYTPAYYLLWNNDLVMAEEFFKRLFAMISDFSSDIILTSTVYYLNDPKRVFSMGGWFNPISGVARVVNTRSCRKEDMNRPIYVDWFGGMGTLIPVSAVGTVGYFDEKQFPQYKGDFDFALRAKKAGFRIIAHPALMVWNDTSQTGFAAKNFSGFVKSFTDRKSQYNLAENIAFYRRHAHKVFGWYGLAARYLRYCAGFAMRWLSRRLSRSGRVFF